MEVMLVLNGHEVSATVDEQERIVLSVAAGRMTRDELTAWVVRHVRPRA
jgi:death-on-curing protein